MELQVLGACLKSRQTNDLVTEHLNDKDFSKEYQIIRGLIKEYYDRDREASRVDPQLLNGIIENSVQNKKHRERFMDMVEQAAGIDVSSANMDELILKGKLTAIGMRLATALVNGDNSVDELYEEYGQIKGMESLDDLTGKGVEVLTIDDMQSVVEAALDGSNLLKVYPLSLNAKLNGGLGGGHHLVTFARPEQGKTAFNLTIACGFASQGASGIYFLNEDRLEDVYLRGLCCITGQPENVIKSDLSKWGEIARDMGFGNIMFVSLAPGTLADIDRFCEKYKPRWIVVDQLRNLQMKETNKVLQLEYATTGIRNIAKKHNLVAVSTTQAGDSAEGKRLLDMGDVDFSNTGVAAQADVLVGVGATREDAEQGVRYLAISKNKRGGGHAQIPVKINTSISRYMPYT